MERAGVATDPARMAAARPGTGHRSLRRGRWSAPGLIYHVTTCTHGRAALFEDYPRARAAAAAIVSTASLRDSRLLAWVLMPDHLHMLLQLGKEDPLSGLVNRIKARSAKATLRVDGKTGRIWARGYHDRAIRRDEDLLSAARYVIANPCRAGLVERPGDYPFWDAMWLTQASR